MRGRGLWLILSVWGFFGTGKGTAFALAVASLFILITMTLSLVIWHISRRARAAQRDRADPASLADRLSGEFDALSGRVRSLDALITLLLPIAAVSLGTTVFAIVFHVVVTTTS
jgi:hypothetical protein